jgi:hypothetical protein
MMIHLTNTQSPILTTNYSLGNRDNQFHIKASAAYGPTIHLHTTYKNKQNNNAVKNVALQLLKNIMTM